MPDSRLYFPRKAYKTYPRSIYLDLNCIFPNAIWNLTVHVSIPIRTQPSTMSVNYGYSVIIATSFALDFDHWCQILSKIYIEFDHWTIYCHWVKRTFLTSDLYNIGYFLEFIKIFWSIVRDQRPHFSLLPQRSYTNHMKHNVCKGLLAES